MIDRDTYYQELYRENDARIKKSDLDFQVMVEDFGHDGDCVQFIFQRKIDGYQVKTGFVISKEILADKNRVAEYLGEMCKVASLDLANYIRKSLMRAT